MKHLKQWNKKFSKMQQTNLTLLYEDGRLTRPPVIGCTGLQQTVLQCESLHILYCFNLESINIDTICPPLWKSLRLWEGIYHHTKKIHCLYLHLSHKIGICWPSLKIKPSNPGPWIDSKKIGDLYNEPVTKTSEKLNTYHITVTHFYFSLDPYSYAAPSVPIKKEP